jgi:hypothetical protein
MIEQKLTTYFSRYKKLSPSADFVASSKRIIVASRQELPALSWRVRIFESVTASGALALASFLLLVIFGGISSIGGGAANVASSNNPEAQALLKEASSLVASVQIKEVDRFVESAEQVVTALDTLSQEVKSN